MGIPRAEAMRVESAAGEDRAQRNDDRGGVVVTAHLADKAAPRPERPADTGEDTFRRPHPMQRCVREYRVELAVKGQILAGHYPRVDTAGPGRSNHLGCGVDAYNRGARRGDLLGQHAVATAQIEDALPC
jgi:hypothetical protein